MNQYIGKGCCVRKKLERIIQDNNVAKIFLKNINECSDFFVVRVVYLALLIIAFEWISSRTCSLYAIAIIGTTRKM